MSIQLSAMHGTGRVKINLTMFDWSKRKSITHPVMIMAGSWFISPSLPPVIGHG